MTSTSPAILFSSATFVPWMGSEPGGLPTQRINWGIRKFSSIAVVTADTETIGPKTEKQSETEQKKTETEAKKIEPIPKIEPKSEKEKQ